MESTRPVSPGAPEGPQPAARGRSAWQAGADGSEVTAQAAPYADVRAMLDALTGGRG